MKIMQVCSADHIGGGEHHVIDLTRGLIERGHELHLAVRPLSPLVEILSGLPIQWHKLLLRNAIDIFSARQLSKIITKNQIEVVHAHIARDYPVVGVATKKLPARFFLTRHHFNPIKSSQLYLKTIRHAQNLIAVSESVKTILANAFPTLRDKIVVIPNWLSSQAVLNLKTREEARNHFKINRPFALAVVGQITPLKGQHLVLEVVRRMVTQNCAADLEVYIFGQSQPKDYAYEQEVRALAHKPELKNHIHFLGAVPHLASYLSAFDIVVAPSINEGFSIAAIEAMNAGAVVIASNIGGLSEIIEHERTGILFPVGEINALKDALLRVMNDESLRVSIASSAQLYARTTFDREVCINRTESLYNRIG